MAQSSKSLREKAEEQLLEVAIPVEAGVAKSATIEELVAELEREEVNASEDEGEE